MAFYKRKKVWKLKDNNVTSENSYNTRREFLKKIGAGSLFLPSASLISRPAFSSLYPPAVNKSYITSRPLTAESLATTYTNFYEFGSSKNIWRRRNCSFPQFAFRISLTGRKSNHGISLQ